MIKYMDLITSQDALKALYKKMAPPLVTLLSSEPEIQYVALRNINLIVQKRPTILSHEIKVFFCKYNDPIYVKLEKLEYMNGFYQFSFPFNEGLCKNIGHFCLPSGIQLWRRAPPEDEWPESFWRNRYYSCCG